MSTKARSGANSPETFAASMPSKYSTASSMLCITATTLDPGRASSNSRFRCSAAKVSSSIITRFFISKVFLRQIGLLLAQFLSFCPQAAGSAPSGFPISCPLQARCRLWAAAYCLPAPSPSPSPPTLSTFTSSGFRSVATLCLMAFSTSSYTLTAGTSRPSSFSSNSSTTRNALP